MLREETKRPVRVRVCGDLARFVNEEDLARLSVEDEQPAAAVVEPGKVCSIDVLLSEQEHQAA